MRAVFLQVGFHPHVKEGYSKNEKGGVHDLLRGTVGKLNNCRLNARFT